ncbi:MAG: stage II sporulation protein M [Candidatus Bathyarchaeia archaeon]
MSLLLFLTSVYAGYSLSETFPVSMVEVFREVFGEVEEWNPFSFLFLIFLNNTVKCFLVILLGFLIGVIPLVFVAVNGFIMGLVAFEVGKISGFPFVLASILPHGVFEVTAFLLCSAIGLRIGYETVKSLRGKGSVKNELVKGINFFVTRALPLLISAAAIEAFVTPLIVNLLFYK